MTAITLAQADRLIDAVLARGAELDCRPLAVIVVEPGCKVKAFKKESVEHLTMLWVKAEQSREILSNELTGLGAIVDAARPEDLLEEQARTRVEELVPIRCGPE